MVSDTELVGRLREFLRTSDLATTTTATVRRKLEEIFGIDLSDRKSFIREQVDLFLGELEDERKEADDDDVGEEGESKEGGEGDGEEGSCEGEEEEEGEEEDEEERSNGGSSRKRGSNKQNKEVKRRGGGFTKVCSLSPQLQKFVGVSELARTEVVKSLWAYIRENNLQDPSNRRKIICDEKLHDLFNTNTIDMFQMNKALTKHIWPLTSEDGPAKPTQKEKQQKKEREDSEESPQKGKRQKGVSLGFLAPLQLSDALAKFLGTGESALPRSDVVKRVWEYIKQNNLQDPADKRIVLCDDKLKELLQVDTFTGFTVAKLLAVHFIKSKQ